jgi:gamma-glutamyltranspeptidase/glutathione hydrolase
VVRAFVDAPMSRLRPRIALAALILASCEASAPPPAPPPPVAPPPAPAVTASATTSASAVASAAPAPSYPQPPPPDPPITLHGGGKRAVRGDGGLVTSVEANATRAGIEVLKRGGNAIDAAVAVGFALAVTHPSAGNIGGGGFMIVRLANGDTTAIDFRETAPAAATPEKNKAMLDAGGVGWASAGVPGTVAGLALARDRFGSRPLAELVAPAITLAKKGHKLGARQALVLGWQWEKLKKDPTARAIWGHGKKALKEGELVKQPDLARTLEAIAKDGKKGFYEGAVAAAIDKAMRAHGGLVTADDLRGYEAKIREPLRFSYRGFDVATMPPPSMGGIAFAEIMLALERQGAHEAPVDSGLSLHLFVEASRRAYAERRIVGADPDFMPPDGGKAVLLKLLGGEHLATRKPAVDRDRATPSTDVPARLDPSEPESPQTTHFSVVDAQGNAVACTYTQSASFGSKVVVPGAGVLLANAMGGFSVSGANKLEPGKRMASSMTPTIVTQGGKLALVLGSPGGDTIPNTVAQVFRNVVDYGMTIDEAVAHPRVHHQYLPDRVRYERAYPPPRAALADLEKRGHKVHGDVAPLGDANNILVDPSGVAWGTSDPREGGKAEGIVRSP